MRECENCARLESERDELKAQLNCDPVYETIAKERDKLKAELEQFRELSKACRIRLKSDGWKDADSCSDFDAVKRYILNSEAKPL